MSDRLEGPEILVGLRDYYANGNRANAGGSFDRRCGRRRWDRRTRRQPFADRCHLFRRELALRWHFDAAFIAQSLEQEAFLRLSRAAKEPSGRSLLDAFHRA